MNSDRETLGDLLVDAASQVFADHGMALADATRCSPVPDWLDPIAVIGFAGETLRATASLEVPWRVLQATHPSRSAATDDLTDWVSELANLTVGLLKRRLRARGVLVQPGLPLSFTTRPAHSAAMSASHLQYRLRSREGSVLVRLTSETTPSFVLGPPVQTEALRAIELF
jgi:hypothetical protein